jgi:CubicO group peptidase (beta-lactamase class C family)
MKKLILFLFLPLLCTSQVVKKNNTVGILKKSSEVVTQVETLIKKYANEHNIPTINVGLILNDSIHYLNYGIKKRNTTKKTDENSIFQIASIGKILTAIVVNDLIIKDKLHLDISISTYLPELYSKRIKKKISAITMRDILHHRSGLPRQSKIIKRRNDEPIIFNYSQKDFEKDFKVMKIKNQGEFKYSNFGYAVASYITERISSSTFEDQLSKISFEYDMKYTSFHCINKNALVTPYREDNRNIEAKNWVLGKLTPPSGIYSSVSDLSKLLLAQLKVYKENDKQNKLFLTNSTRNAWNGTGIYYGFGLFDWGNGGFGHGGSMDGYGGDYWFNPKENVGFVLLTSSGGKWVSKLSKELNQILINKK